MKRKSFETLFYSTIGVVAMLLILVAINYISGHFKQRIDLTAEKAYTLSPGTRAILAKLDTPVQLRYYCSQGENAMPVYLKTYAQRVEDLIGEYRQASKGLVEVQKLDPEPDSDAEDSAKLDGVEGQILPTGERLYLGLSVSMLDQKQAIPFLPPDRERLLEYDISRAIARVVATDKPVIGVMSPLPVMGQMSPMMMQQGGGQPPLAFISELKRDFTLKQVDVMADKIPDEIKVLLVIHPKTISDTGQFALDQFVLRGGKLIAFLDPLCALDRQSSMFGGSPPSSSSLDKLLKAWGLTFDQGKVLADMDYVGRTRQGRAPAVLALTEKAMNKDDVVTADVDNLFMVFAGVFSGTPPEGLKETVLIESSKQSQLVDPMLVQMSGEAIAKDFAPSGTEYPLAIRLTGKFKTAFPDGKPKRAEANPADKKPEQSAPGLKESAQENSVVLVGDSDMIQDPIAVSEVPNPFGQRILTPANGNLGFAQGIVEQLTGDSNLIAVRSRATRERPFTVVKQMQEQAEANYRSKIKELEAGLADAQQKLNELQKSKDSSQRFILSPEQQQELASFRKKEAEVKAELKTVRKNLRSDIDSLENRIKWLNIAGMPALVAAFGLGLAILKSKRAAAK